MAEYPLNFADAKKILLNRLGEKQELSAFKAKLWRNKQGETTSVHKYYQKTQYLVETIKSLAKQDPDYAKSWPAISKFIDQDALAAFVSGLNEFYFGHALSARPKTLEDAYAFLCEFTSSERIARGEKQNEHKNKRDNKTNKFNATPKNEKSNTYEPMEIDPSLRSRITLNKRNINNHEVEHSDHESESENEVESEELDLNFQMVSKDQTKSWTFYLTLPYNTQ